MDPQGNATSGMGFDKNTLETTIYDTLFDPALARSVITETVMPYLWIMPANQQLTGAEVELVTETGREQKLKQMLTDIKNDYEYLVIDCPPSLGLLTRNVLTAADSL